MFYLGHKSFWLESKGHTLSDRLSQAEKERVSLAKRREGKTRGGYMYARGGYMYARGGKVRLDKTRLD